MAVRRRTTESDEQLDLFSTARPTYDTADSIRPDGRETLARPLPKDGPRTGDEGAALSDASRSRGEDEGRNGHAANGVHETGVNGRSSPPAGVGDGAGEIHPAPARDLAIRHDAEGHRRRHKEASLRNLNNYRITEDDRLGEGGPKQKFQLNLKAIRQLRALEVEARPATHEEKAVLVKYVGWGAMPQVFDEFNVLWLEQREALRKELTQEEYEFARSTAFDDTKRALHVTDRYRCDVSRVGAVRLSGRQNS